MRSLNLIFTFSVCLCLPMLTGCSSDETKTTDSAATEAPEASLGESSSDPEWALETDSSDKKKNDTPSEMLPIRTVDETEYAKLLEEQKGKVVFVDFWATWCIPCRQVFPETVTLANELKEKGLVVVSMALDDDIAEFEAQKFLTQQKAGELINLRSKYGSDDPSFKKYEIGSEGLPHYKLYGRDGQLIKSFSLNDDGTAPTGMNATIEHALSQGE